MLTALGKVVRPPLPKKDSPIHTHVLALLWGLWACPLLQPGRLDQALCLLAYRPHSALSRTFTLRLAGAFTLRQRMLNFVQNIQYYMMFEVMEPTWHVLEKNLRSVSAVVYADWAGPHSVRQSSSC